MLKDKRIYEVQAPRGGKGKGTLEFADFQLIEVPSFVDYLKGGLRIDLAVAIDFTLSNGDPSSRYSNHYIGGHNQYEHAIWDVGSILEPYSYDHIFPTFGFGAVPPGGTQVEHCFPLNGN